MNLLKSRCLKIFKIFTIYPLIENGYLNKNNNLYLRQSFILLNIRKIIVFKEIMIKMKR
jgi:hypothetical protein